MKRNSNNDDGTQSGLKIAKVIEIGRSAIQNVTDTTLPVQLVSAGDKLLVTLFYRNNCNLSSKCVSGFTELAAKSAQNVLFAQVNLDDPDCKDMSKSVTEYPFYILYRNGVKIDKMQGHNPWEILNKISQHTGKSFQSGDISHFIKTDICECLNESDETAFQDFLDHKANLRSDCDEQLILVYGFSQKVNIHSIQIKAPDERGPKTMKFFVNQTKTLGFDDVTSYTPAQTIKLTVEDVLGDNPVPLHTVKFQNVINLQIFIEDNLGEEEVTEIESLTLIGAPLVHGKMRQGGTYVIDCDAE